MSRIRQLATATAAASQSVRIALSGIVTAGSGRRVTAPMPVK